MNEYPHDEWSSALAEAQASRPAGDEGMTASEIAELWHMSESTARKRLGDLKRAGRITTGSRAILRLDERRGQVPVYRINPA